MLYITSIIAFILILSSGSYGATIEVGSGQTYETIQAAVDAASCGDVINVHTGAYAENVATTQDCTAGNYLTIQSNSGDSPTMQRISINHNYHILSGFSFTTTDGTPITIAKSTDHITIQNCSICPSYASQNGIHLSINTASDPYTGPTNVAISNNTFGPCTTALGKSIYLTGSLHSVSGNTFNYYNGQDSIYLYSDNTTISENIFNGINHAPGVGNHPDAIQTGATDSKHHAKNIIIEKNIFKNMSGQSLYTEYLDMTHENLNHWTVRNNIFVNIGAKAHQVTGDNSTVYNNTYYLCTRNTVHPVGFRTEDGDKILKNNIIVGCGSSPGSATYGLYTDDDSSVVHSNNMYADDPVNSFGAKTITETGVVNGGNPLFTNVNKDWVWIDDNNNTSPGYGGDSTHFEVSSTDVSKFVLGEYIEYCPYITGCDSVVRTITDVTGNIVTFTPEISGYSERYCWEGSICDAMVLLWGSSTNFTMDFTIQALSPAYDTGADLSAYFTTDYVGVTRPQGAAWDIGAYEYLDTAPTASHFGGSGSFNIR